jgi:(1->4)-alpha-D-glucan 1-alpha-D-glucosylmutase
VFARGTFRPLAVEGPHRDHVIAFARVLGDEAAILVAGRHFASLTDGGRHWPRPQQWKGQVILGDLRLIDGPDGPLTLTKAFDVAPVAALTAVRTSARATVEAS